MKDEPREQKAPDGAEQPTVEHRTEATPPTAATDTPTPGDPAGAPIPAAGQGDATAVFAAEPAAQPTPAAGQPEAAAPDAEPAVQPTPAAGQGEAAAAGATAAQGTSDPAASGTTPADQTAVHGQQPPPGPQFAQAGPGHPYAPWGPPQAAQRPPGGFRRFAGHRATQLVGVGVLGMLVGAGIVGGIAAAASHHGPRDGRPGIHRQYDGPNQGFDGRGPGFGGRGNADSGPGSGSGDGI